MSNIMKDAMKKAGVTTSIKRANNKPNGSMKKIPNVSESMKGTIKWFNFTKGYGFIVGDDGQEYFVYHKHIVTGRTYTGFDTNDRVTFRVTADPNTRRVNAINVSLDLDDAASAPAEEKETEVKAEDSAEPES